MPEFEYTIRYCASSNISFHNEHDHEWYPWEGDEDATAEDIEKTLSDLPDPSRITNMPDGLDMAINASGFEWWVEVREVGADENGTD